MYHINFLFENIYTIIDQQKSLRKFNQHSIIKNTEMQQIQGREFFKINHFIKCASIIIKILNITCVLNKKTLNSKPLKCLKGFKKKQ